MKDYEIDVPMEVIMGVDPAVTSKEQLLLIQIQRGFIEDLERSRNRWRWCAAWFLVCWVGVSLEAVLT